MEKANLFSNIPNALPEEIFENLLEHKHFKLERIVSCGQSTPPGDWYDQDKNEWIILLKGCAGLLFEDEPHLIEMHSGDYIHIPAHKKHRVEWTDEKQTTVWLALHYK